MSLTNIQRQSGIEKRRQGCHFFASGSAEMNDDFSGPTGMDAQRQGCRRGAWPGKIERMRITLQKAKSWACFCSCKTGISAIHGGQV
ncbi:MAG: hypothetical protein KYX62_04435 [Pseudomonadota bacterium]|nr:hypothetical protein [Pseudomonadota bacterium]